MSDNRRSGLYPLSPNAIRKISLFGVDTETYDKNRKFALASIVGEDYSKVFKTREDIQKEIATNQAFRNGYLCATNLMFDFNALYPDFIDAVKQFHVIERGGDIILAKGYVPYKPDGRVHSIEELRQKKADLKDYYNITFIDSISHLKASVENLGKIIGVNKLVKPSFLGLKPKTASEWKELEEYNLQDSRVTYEFMSWLQTWYNNLGGNLKPTISSTALDLFRRRYLNGVWYQQPRDVVIPTYKAYYGGRSEAFKRGLFDRRINVYDVNSLYPYVMKNFEFPLPSSYVITPNPSPKDIDNYFGTAHFTLKCPRDMYMPFVPVLTEKLRFPCGVVKGFYDFSTIRKAIDEGYEVLDVRDGIVYHDGFRPFKEYVETLYSARMKLKAEGNAAEIVPKICLNSTYGKFAYRFFDKEFLTDFEGTLNYWEDTIIPIIDGKLYRVRTTAESEIPKYVFPIIPVYVTAYSRLLMREKFHNIGEDRVYYTDTDSIMTDRTLSTSNELGDMKLEKAFERLCIVKPKMYCGTLLDGTPSIKIKGVHNSEANRSFDVFMKMVESNSFRVRTELFRKLRGSLIGVKRYVNEPYEMRKELELEDNKRWWAKDRFSITPQESEPIDYVDADYQLGKI